ncbi:MAG TPA: DUF6249 domain-containing protein [Puia sp.]|nr:DUF6249 domain-containing protein [Puia sp.]
MDSQQLFGMIIGAVAVVGGLSIGMVSIIVSVPWTYKEKLARLEATNKERLALIEKGFDPALIFKEKKKAGNDPLFWGLLLVGLGAGFILGYLLHKATGWSFGIMAHGMPLVLGGASMIGYFVYRKRTDK